MPEEFCFHAAYQREHDSESIPAGFDAIIHPLDARLESKLDWEIHAPTIPTLFDLNLGLFDELKKPIQHVAQFQALSFAVQRFVDKIDFPAGCILYKGPLLQDDASIDFLNLLVTSIPPHITPYTLQDATHRTPIQFAESLLKQSQEGLHLAIQNAPFAHDGAIWNSGSARGPYIGRTRNAQKQAPLATVGLIIHDEVTEFESTIEELIQEKTGFRLIREERITAEWDGLEQLILPKRMQPGTLRMLKGFEAAGGTIKSMK